MNIPGGLEFRCNTPQDVLLTHVAVDLDVLPHKLNFGVGVLYQRCQALLDGLNLLGYCGEDALFETVELIETAPCSHLTKTNEDTTHGLEIESFVTAENEDEAAKLDTKSFD